MKLYNSATRTKEEFVPLHPDIVKMYTCGPTVYHYAHIGNLRSYIMEDVLEKFLRYDGYDVTMRLTNDDPMEPVIEMDEDQVLSDEQTVFGQINADNKILGTVSPYYDSYYNTCQKYASIWLYVYLKDLGTMVGTVGHYYNVLEWVSLEEAVRLKIENNMSGARDPRDDPDYPRNNQVNADRE